MSFFRKKPVVVEALLWSGDEENVKEMHAFLAPGKQYTHSRIEPFKPLSINTGHGIAMVELGDYVMKGVQGEYYPCAASIFEKTYEPAV